MRFVFVAAALSSAWPAYALTCKDVLALVNAGVAPPNVVETIGTSGTTFSAVDVACIQDGGAPPEVVAAAGALVGTGGVDADQAANTIEDVATVTVATINAVQQVQAALDQQKPRVDHKQSATADSASKRRNGIYRIEVRRVTLPNTKPDGRRWDVSLGAEVLPDPMVDIAVAGLWRNLGHGTNANQVGFEGFNVHVPAGQAMPIQLIVREYDASGAHDPVGECSLTFNEAIHGASVRCGAAKVDLLATFVGAAR